MNGIAADVAVAGGVATVRLNGTLSSGGALSASGTVGIDAAKGFPANLAVKIADARYTDGRIVTANLSGDVALKGQLTQQPLLSGTINLAKTVITIPERLPGSLTTLGVKHKNAPAAVREQEEAIRPAAAGSGGGSGLNLDLTVNAPQQIFVRGRGLDAELGGSIRLTGPLASPRAIGQFTLRRGRLAILGKRLAFTRGTLGFSGSLIPTLDLAAESTASGATVTINVTGLATNPKFNFSSSPSLPQDEVLARLVFGRSMSNLSPLQIAQLADAAAQLAGGGGSTSLLETLRGKVGVDDLDVKTNVRRQSRRVRRQVPERPHLRHHREGRKGQLRQGHDRPRCRARRQAARRSERKMAIPRAAFSTNESIERMSGPMRCRARPGTIGRCGLALSAMPANVSAWRCWRRIFGIRLALTILRQDCRFPANRLPSKVADLTGVPSRPL